MDTVIKDFCSTADRRYKEIAELLSRTIMTANKNIRPAIKWKKLTFGLDGDFHHWLCAVNFTKKGVVLYFHFGGLLKDTHHVLIAGESKFLRKIEYGEINELDPKIIVGYVQQAIAELDHFKAHWKELNAK